MSRIGRRSATAAAALLVAAAAAGLAGCTQDQPTSGKPTVVTSIYALQFAAAAVAGDAATVTNLTPAGVEPHDLELSVQQVKQLHDADVLVYVAGLAQAVDDSVREADGQKLEALSILGADAIAGDPHFWLNPLLMVKIADAVAKQLSSVDPSNKDSYSANASAFAERMTALDQQWQTRTATCDSRDFVSSHASFGYMAKRYNLTAHAVLGLNPDAEPTPAALNAAISIIRDKALTTVYTEALGSNRIAKTIAKETGAQVQVLDPMEGNTDKLGYVAIMEANLYSFVAGNGCER